MPTGSGAIILILRMSAAMDMVEEEMLLSSVEKGSGVEGSVEEGSVEEGEEPPHDQSAPRVLSRWRWWPLVELIALIKLALPTVSECTSTTHTHTRTHARTHTHTHTHTGLDAVLPTVCVQHCHPLCWSHLWLLQRVGRSL